MTDTIVDSRIFGQLLAVKSGMQDAPVCIVAIFVQSLAFKAARN